MNRTFATLGLVATLVAACPTGAAGQASDRLVAEQVADSIRSYARFSIFDDIGVDVVKGHVRLSGRVTVPVKKQEVGERVSGVDGVVDVTNDIGVLPVSPVDDRLRRVVANAIYSHPNFWRYAERPHPPIHIIIEHQHVTLTGNVESQSDRVLAYSLAQVSGVIGVDNRLRVAP